MKEYEIIDIGNNKRAIIYYSDGLEETRELYSQPGFVAEIKLGYKLKNAPNWYGLEQALFYSAEFPKAVTTADPNWFTVFSSTLQNGKRGEATENAFLLAFTNLGVSWTSQEKANINGYLTANNFSIQIA